MSEQQHMPLAYAQDPHHPCHGYIIQPTKSNLRIIRLILKQQQQEQQDQYVIEGRRGRQDANREWIKQHSGTLPSLEAARTRRDEMSEEKKKKEARPHTKNQSDRREGEARHGHRARGVEVTVNFRNEAGHKRTFSTSFMDYGQNVKQGRYGSSRRVADKAAVSDAVPRRARAPGGDMRSEVTTAGNPTSLAAHNTGGGNHHPALLPSGTNPYQRTNVDNAAQQAGVPAADPMLLDEGAPDAETEDTSVLAKGSQSKALVAPEGCRALKGGDRTPAAGSSAGSLHTPTAHKSAPSTAGRAGADETAQPFPAKTSLHGGPQQLQKPPPAATSNKPAHSILDVFGNIAGSSGHEPSSEEVYAVLKAAADGGFLATSCNGINQLACPAAAAGAAACPPPAQPSPPCGGGTQSKTPLAGSAAGLAAGLSRKSSPELPVSLHPLASPLLSDDSQPDGAGVNGNKTCSSGEAAASGAASILLANASAQLIDMSVKAVSAFGVAAGGLRRVASKFTSLGLKQFEAATRAGAGTGSQAVPCRQGTHSQACSRQHQDIMLDLQGINVDALSDAAKTTPMTATETGIGRHVPEQPAHVSVAARLQAMKARRKAEAEQKAAVREAAYACSPPLSPTDDLLGRVPTTAAPFATTSRSSSGHAPGSGQPPILAATDSRSEHFDQLAGGSNVMRHSHSSDGARSTGQGQNRSSGASMEVARSSQGTGLVAGGMNSSRLHGSAAGGLGQPGSTTAGNRQEPSMSTSLQQAPLAVPPADPARQPTTGCTDNSSRSLKEMRPGASGQLQCSPVSGLVASAAAADRMQGFGTPLHRHKGSSAPFAADTTGPAMGQQHLPSAANDQAVAVGDPPGAQQEVFYTPQQPSGHQAGDSCLGSSGLWETPLTGRYAGVVDSPDSMVLLASPPVDAA